MLKGYKTGILPSEVSYLQLKLKMRIAIYSKLLLLLPIRSCNVKTSEINKVKWLQGTWANNTPQGILYEHWQQLNDSALSGTSYFMENGDTVLFERIHLVERNNNLFFIVTGADPKNNGPIEFKGTKVETDQFRFENPAHDFPQVIYYQRVGTDSILAHVSLLSGEKKQLFPMKKIK